MKAKKARVEKSKNFDRNLDSGAMKKQIKKNTLKGASVLNTSAKQNFVPISTRETINSMRVNQKNERVELSSINHPSRKNSKGRYFDTSPNKTYKTKSGNVIPAGKNAGKNLWYDRSFKKNKNKLLKIQNEGVIAK